MTKLCSVCGTENRDEVQFCRACGTAFSALASPSSAAPADGPPQSGVACSECGFQNKPGVRYCANCGLSLVEAGGGASLPPISYPTFAPVAPYPPPTEEAAAASLPDYPPAYDPAAAPPDIADPDAVAAARAAAAYDAQSAAPTSAQAGAPAARTPLVIGIVALLLAGAGAAAWWFLNGSGRAQPVSAAASAPVFAASAALAPLPVASEPASAAIAVETAPSNPFAPLTNEALLAPSAAESAASDVEARRIAAEKRREKAAKDKAERDAKAKTLADEQQAAAAAAARAEQEAQARRRAEEAQRPRAPAAPATQAPVVAQPRGVREICAGRGTIGEAICQSRECGAAEHANEAICRQIRDADERRRNYSN